MTDARRSGHRRRRSVRASLALLSVAAGTAVVLFVQSSASISRLAGDVERERFGVAAHGGAQREVHRVSDALLRLRFGGDLSAVELYRGLLLQHLRAIAGQKDGDDRTEIDRIADELRALDWDGLTLAVAGGSADALDAVLGPLDTALFEIDQRLRRAQNRAETAFYRSAERQLAVKQQSERSLLALVASTVAFAATWGVFVVVQRRRTEHALLDSEGMFRSVAETASDAIVSADVQGSIVYLNGAAEQVFGWPAADVVGRPLTDLMSAEGFEHGSSAGLAGIIPTGESRVAGRPIELVGLHRSGTKFPVELSLASWSAGGEAFLTAIIHDVSDRKRVLGELEQALSLVTATLESTADGILVVDRDGKISGFNQRFVNMWQIPESVLAARDDKAALAFVVDQLTDPQRFLDKVEELYASQAHSHDELQFRDGRIVERYSQPQCVTGQTVGRVWSFRDVTERKRLEAELTHQAFHDSLTGLANRALFTDRVEHALQRRARRPGSIAVLLVDLDNFKTVNDSLGHTVGDQLLVEIGRRLLTALRPDDTIARLGGDEFAILVEELAHADDVHHVAERVLDAFRQPFSADGTDMWVRASVGIAIDQTAASGEELLRDADTAMYAAKAGGGARFSMYEAHMHHAALQLLETETDLRQAVDAGQLEVAYQPIVDLATGQVTSTEALARWNHPQRGPIPPAEFILVAERSGLIIPLGLHVLDQACRQTHAWTDAGVADLTVSVNLSPRQLRDPNLVHTVAQALRTSGLEPARLTLEITESVLMDDADEALRVLNALKALGIKLAVDDFGTGFSSLGYIKRFPLDIIKIDMVFVSGMSTSPDGSAIVRAIIQLGKALGLKIVAEGVEEPEQATELRQLGCDLAQGFLYSRPIAPREIARLLAASAAKLATPAS